MPLTRSKHRARVKSWLIVTKVLALLLGAHFVEPNTEVDSTSQQPQTEQSQAEKTPRSPQTFNHLMTIAHQYLEQENWSNAVQVLKQAIQLKPKSTAAQDLLAEAELALAQTQQLNLIAAFNAANLQEQWAEALAIADMLTTPNHEVSHAIDRVRQLVSLERQIDRLLTTHGHWSRPHSLDRLNQVFDASSNIDVGVRIEEKLTKLHELNTLWNIPIQVTLKSDRRSSVLVHPGKALGKFRQLTLELKPGTYRILARRQGYREATQLLVIKPGDEPQTLDIRATERF